MSRNFRAFGFLALFLLPVLSLCSVWGSIVIIGPPNNPPNPPQPPIILPPVIAENDNFADAISLSGNSVLLSGNNQNATAEPGEPGSFSRSVWYRWTAPADGTVQMDTETFNIRVYTGDTLTNLSPVSISYVQSGVPFFYQFYPQFQVAAGVTYSIAINEAISGNGASFNIPFSFGTVKVSPPAGAHLIAGRIVKFQFSPTITNMNIPYLEAFVDGVSIGKKTAPLEFDFMSSDQGEHLLTANGTNSLGESVQLTPTPLLFGPDNDDFTNAIVIPGGLTKGNFVGEVYYATTEPGEPVSGAQHSVWWTWTPAYPIPVYIWSDGRLNIFQRDGSGDLVSVMDLGENQGFGLFMPTPGQQYWIALDQSKPTLFSPPSWNFQQSTLSLSPIPSTAFTQEPVKLHAIWSETNTPPVKMTFVIGRQDPGGHIFYLGSLGQVIGPSYDFTWLPDQAGSFFLWARCTNALGVVQESQKIHVGVFRDNDTLAGARQVPATLISTNYTFSFTGAEADPDEPPHRFGPAEHTLWWKWTPRLGGLYRIKARQHDFGLPLDFFLQNKNGKLVRLADNEGMAYFPGYSGALRVATTPGNTYFIRVDHGEFFTFEDRSEPATLTIEPASTPLPGELLFSFISPRPSDLHWPPVVGRVLNPYGYPITSDRYRAQLYVGTSSTNLKPYGQSQQFIGDLPSDHPWNGTIAPTSVLLPGIRAGTRVYAQIRVWDISSGSSYEDPRSRRGLMGASGMMHVITGSEEAGPGHLVGLSSFTLHGPTPTVPIGGH